MPKERMQYNWFNTRNEDRAKWESLCPPGEYRVYPGTVLTGLLPEALISQYNSVFITASGTPSGNIYYMANGNRIDNRDNAIDQMPFGMGFVGDGPIPSGCLIQHGGWDDRTTYPPQEFWELVMVSGTGSFYPLSEMPIANAGKVTDLRINSQHAAFGKLVDVLKDQVGE